MGSQHWEPAGTHTAGESLVSLGIFVLGQERGRGRGLTVPAKHGTVINAVCGWTCLARLFLGTAPVSNAGEASATKRALGLVAASCVGGHAAAMAAGNFAVPGAVGGLADEQVGGVVADGGAHDGRVEGKFGRGYGCSTQQHVEQQKRESLGGGHGDDIDDGGLVFSKPT